ncbi:hypothetical protein DEU56DRAFT_915138 [Suillus clintonianus]|uniref:uncharacterized protein n=1 Tax=Suillus clintonianus TaxID=1904413 RepID=UPI001B87E1EB|nr:uncharacterized protein DEU56DRAFT_915138 [Suillus clintonianus]KAG2129633.1 hypothetical protein DEU56DRAFT_915138 [Suillus clintonianus]
MLQPESQTFKLQGRGFNVNVNVRIELVGDDNESREELATVCESNIDVDDPTLHKDVAPPQPANEHEKDQVDSMARLNERLQLVEMNCSRLEELYKIYRLRWLEENFRVRALQKYAPDGVSTYSPRQITWDAPSPAQSGYDVEFEGQE